MHLAYGNRKTLGQGRDTIGLCSFDQMRSHSLNQCPKSQTGSRLSSFLEPCYERENFFIVRTGKEDMQVVSAGQLLQGLLLSETSDNILSWESSHTQCLLQRAAWESQCLVSVGFEGQCVCFARPLIKHYSRPTIGSSVQNWFCL